MNPAERSSRVLATADLLPESWSDLSAAGPVRMFNPGLLRHGQDWILAYRVVGTDGRRRIGLCRLDDDLRVRPESRIPLSDWVRFRPEASHVAETTQWLADPRLYRLNGRVFVYWNSGWHEPRNWQFLQELDPRNLHPVGPPRELVLRGERQKLEKNWTLFEGDEPGAVFAVYSLLPLRILRVSLAGDGAVVAEDAFQHAWSLAGYPPSHGGLRGGAPPVRHEGSFWTFCHSVHDSPGGYRYRAAVCRFADQAPFAPQQGPRHPLELNNPFGERRTFARLNPAVGEVIYPCGAAWDGARWLVSHGINDEHCGISILEHATVADSLAAVPLANDACPPGQPA